MCRISFYHLTTSPLDQALPKLMEKVYVSGESALVLTESAGQTDMLNGLLWTYSPDSFLPHGTEKDGSAEMQPIFITDSYKNPNNASVLVILNQNPPENIDDFNRCLYMFSGNESGSLAQARRQWKKFKDLGHDLTYWQQDTRGAWKQAN